MNKGKENKKQDHRRKKSLMASEFLPETEHAANKGHHKGNVKGVSVSKTSERHDGHIKKNKHQAVNGNRPAQSQKKAQNDGNVKSRDDSVEAESEDFNDSEDDEDDAFDTVQSEEEAMDDVIDDQEESENTSDDAGVSDVDDGGVHDDGGHGIFADEDHGNGDDEEDAKRGHPEGSGPTRHDGREELKRLMAVDQRTMTASITEAARADAVKGKAVKEQRRKFDRVLDARMKMQKGWTAINQLAVTGLLPDPDGAAIQSAESAALALWSSLENLRLAMATAHSPDQSNKRKRSPVSTTTSTTSLWKRMADLEAESVAHRRSVLDKWSLKVRGSNATVPNARGKLLGSSGQQNLSAILDAQVASETGERSAKHARGNDSEPAYDDTAFYQSLLRDLVEQRLSSDSITSGLDNLNLQLPSRLSVHPVTGMRKDKVKRDVDTRASKGRKMKFHVHEKLQNFMAPEDRGTWTDRAREEFFASLLGRTASGLLGENDEETQSDEDMEEGGLKLFRG